MVGWHHQLSGREFEQTLGDGEGQGSLACCSLWGHKESDKTYQLNNTNSCHLMTTKSTAHLEKASLFRNKINPLQAENQNL